MAPSPPGSSAGWRLAPLSAGAANGAYYGPAIITAPARSITRRGPATGHTSACGTAGAGAAARAGLRLSASVHIPSTNRGKSPVFSRNAGFFRGGLNRRHQISDKLSLLLYRAGTGLASPCCRPRPPRTWREDPMKKTILALAAAATIAAGALTTPTPADARCYGCGVGARCCRRPRPGATIAQFRPVRAMRRRPAMSSTTAMVSPIRSLARAATGPAGRCTTVTATSSAGAAPRFICPLSLA